MRKMTTVLRGWAVALVVLALLCVGVVANPVNTQAEVAIPTIDGFVAGQVHDAGGGYSQLTYTDVSLSQMKAYEQKLLREGYGLYDQREIKNGTKTNRFATYIKGDMMIHINLFAPLSKDQFHVIYGPSDKLVPNTQAGSFTPVVTPSVATIERSDGVLCMVVQLADGSYYIIDGGYGYSPSEPTTLPAKEEHRDGSGITYTYTRDHVRDMDTLLAYLKDTNRDGKIDTADRRPQVTWMITHADADHIQLPYIFMKNHSSEFDLDAIYYNFPDFEKIGLSSSYNAQDLNARAWSSLPDYKNTYFPNAEEYVYHTGQTVALPGCTLEFLYTPEDLYPQNMTTPNHTCGIWRFCFDNGKTFLVTGDAEVSTNKQAAKVLGSYLQSDMLQVIHHGSNGGTTDFYSAVDPDICLWPCLDISFYHDLRHQGLYKNYEFNQVLRNGQRTHYTTSATNAVFLPTLRYDANGGEGQMDAVGTLYSGNAAAEGTSPKGLVTVAANGFAGPEGRAFLGWSTAPDGAVEYQPGEQLAVKGDTVLYAQWEAVREEPEIVLAKVSGSSMTLGNTLEINFAVNPKNFTGTDNYIVVTKEYADERGIVSKTYPQAQWISLNASTSYVSFSVSAKEMNDKLTVVVYNAQGQALTEVYEDSVATYCVRMAGKELEKTAPVAKKITLYVDMVNYGAAAQQKWNYNTDALANANLTDVLKAYATEISGNENILDGGTGFVGTSLSLKENILMNVAYNPQQITDVTYAVVSFTDHYGNDSSMTVQRSEFVTLSATTAYIEIDIMGVADYEQPVTVKLYNAADECVSTTIDSMESYAVRQIEKNADVALFEAILAFGKGAWNYFHT